MSLPPIKRDWATANEFERRGSCRACGKGIGEVKELNLAHVMGRAHDRLIFIGDWENQYGDTIYCRLFRVDTESVIELCGPPLETGTCHNLYDTHRLDIWDILSPEKKARAIEDCRGQLGLAMRRCAPLTWDSRLDIVDGLVVERSLETAS